MAKFPLYYQLDAMDCGPSCLRMISKFYGKEYSIQSLREQCSITREGVSLLGVSDAANAIGLKNVGAKLSFERLLEAPLPCIVHWKQNHFVVVYRISDNKVWVADPAQGHLKYSKQEFLEGWIGDGSEGLCMLLEPTEEFKQNEEERKKPGPFSYLFTYVKPYKKQIVKLVIGLFVGSIMMLIFPFLTQAVVDVGIKNNDLSYVTLILLAQVALFVAMSVVDIIRSWILLHLSMRINISLISDFLVKLMKLPLGFFDSKLTGDLLQRIGDQNRVERFLTTSTLNMMFSLFSVVVFSMVLLFYSWKIFSVFMIGAILYMLWILLFMKRRQMLDHMKFEQQSRNQNKLIEIIKGIQEIKLNNSEDQKRKEWEKIQVKLFEVNKKSMTLGLKQDQGAEFILRMVGVMTTFLAARFVIQDEITLGTMLAIAFIVGQLNAPIDQLLLFIQTAQDAKLSLERLGEVHDQKDEEVPGDHKLSSLPHDRSIRLENVSYQYEGPRSPFVLKDVSLKIPQGKTTAIVGVSGSGKTTLMKLLLGFFQPVDGEIKVGDKLLHEISGPFWRGNCGVVMQDGYVFSDSIANNISVGDATHDNARVVEAAQLANLSDFVDSLPLKYSSKIGDEGAGLSQGQRQRLLIARAMYKKPEYLFFDEATNALDSKNERQVIENLDLFSKGRTLLVIAHRLSTVKNADQIVVLDKGCIVEKGTHEALIEQKGKYFELVKEQLDLGA